MPLRKVNPGDVITSADWNAMVDAIEASGPAPSPPQEDVVTAVLTHVNGEEVAIHPPLALAGSQMDLTFEGTFPTSSVYAVTLAESAAAIERRTASGWEYKLPVEVDASADDSFDISVRVGTGATTMRIRIEDTGNARRFGVVEQALVAVPVAEEEYYDMQASELEDLLGPVVSFMAKDVHWLVSDGWQFRSPGIRG